MAMFIVSSLLGGLNYISTILNMRTKGMSMTRLPLTMWAIFFTAVLGVLSFPVLLSGAILLLFDRNLGTSFYLSDIVVKGEILPNEGGAPFSSNTCSGSSVTRKYILSCCLRWEWFLKYECEFTQTHLWLSGDGRFTVCDPHPGVPGLGTPYVCNRIESFPWSFFVLLTLLIAVPSAIKVFNWLTTLWRGNLRFTPAMLLPLAL